MAIASLETVTVEIFKPKAKSFLINTWYRPPNTPIDLFEDDEICIKKMDAEDKEPICIGDFNCDWLLRKKQPHTTGLAELNEMYQFEQIIEKPSRIADKTKGLIDLIFSNKPELIVKSGIENIEISYHSFIYVHRKISIPRKPPKIIKTRQYNIPLFKSELKKY